MTAIIRKESARKALERINSKVYGILLDEDGSTVSNLIKNRWEEFDKMLKRGESNFVTFGFLESPPVLPPYYIERWKERLELDLNDDELAALWREWTTPRRAGDEFQYLEQFGLVAQAQAIPCLILFTKLDSDKAAIRSIPDWNEDDLWWFFVAIVDNLYECSLRHPDDADARLECIRQTLTSHWAIAGMGLKYFGKNGKRFIKEHPTYIVDTVAGMVGGMARGKIFLQDGGR